MKFIATLLIIIGSAGQAVAVEPLIISGAGEALSGDSIRIDNHIIKLSGIIAPSVEQNCEDVELGNYPCGQVSKNNLQSFIDGKRIECIPLRWSDNGEKISECSYQGKSLSNIMLLSGWAITKWFDRDENKRPVKCSLQTCETQPNNHFKSELDAISNNRGLWSSKFDLPWKLYEF